MFQCRTLYIQSLKDDYIIIRWCYVCLQACVFTKFVEVREWEGWVSKEQSKNEFTLKMVCPSRKEIWH